MLRIDETKDNMDLKEQTKVRTKQLRNLGLKFSFSTGDFTATFNDFVVTVDPLDITCYTERDWNKLIATISKNKQR